MRIHLLLLILISLVAGANAQKQIQKENKALRQFEKVSDCGQKTDSLAPETGNPDNSKAISLLQKQSNGKFRIRNHTYGMLQVEILSITGTRVFPTRLAPDEIDLSGIPKGIYTVRFHTDDKVYLKQIVRK